MAFTVLKTVNWGTGPVLPITIAYEMQRNGSNMQYRIRLTVSELPTTGSAYFGYPIYLEMKLAGSVKISQGNIKKASPSKWDDPIVYTTSWYTVSNKTSGTTSLSTRLFSGSGSTRNTTYTYTLPIVPALSTMEFDPIYIDIDTEIRVTKEDSSYKHKITYAFGSKSGTAVAMTTNTTVQWLPPTSLYSELPNATSGKGTLTITTYNSSNTKLGSKDYTFTLRVHSSIKPAITTCTVTPKNTASSWLNTNHPNLFVKSISQAVFHVVASAGTGSTIKSCNITGDAGESTSGFTTSSIDYSFTSSVLSLFGSLSSTVKVVDGRSLSASQTLQFRCYNYATPGFRKLEYTRGTYVSGVWTSDEVNGTDLRVSVQGNISLTGISSPANSATIRISLDTTLMHTITNHTGASETTVYITDVGTTTQYTLTAEITDAIGNSSTMSVVVTSVKDLLNLDFELDSIGVGTIPQSEGSVEIDKYVKLKGMLDLGPYRLDDPGTLSPSTSQEILSNYIQFADNNLFKSQSVRIKHIPSLGLTFFRMYFATNGPVAADTYDIATINSKYNLGFYVPLSVYAGKHLCVVKDTDGVIKLRALEQIGTATTSSFGIYVAGAWIQ